MLHPPPSFQPAGMWEGLHDGRTPGISCGVGFSPFSDTPMSKVWCLSSTYAVLPLQKVPLLKPKENSLVNSWLNHSECAFLKATLVVSVFWRILSLLPMGLCAWNVARLNVVQSEVEGGVYVNGGAYQWTKGGWKQCKYCTPYHHNPFIPVHEWLLIFSGACQCT